jgi:hypothetical protein
MGFTKRSDLIIPEILMETVQAAFVGATALYGSSAVTVNMSLPGDKRGGDTVSVPYFSALGEAEDIAVEGDALTPEGITATKETASVIHTGKAFSITQWAQWAAHGDPYEEAARQIVEIMKRRWDKALITTASTGVPAAFIYDCTGLTNKNLTYSNVLKARQKWGDEQERVSLIAVHSDIYFDILGQTDAHNRPLVSMETEGPDGYQPTRWGGALLVPSDKCTKTLVSGTTYNYESYLLKEKSLVIWANGSVSTDTDKDILADAHIMATHHYFAAHRYLRAPGSSKSPAVKVLNQLTL